MDIKLHGAQAPKSRVYILTDEAGRVLRLEGEYSLPADLTGWIWPRATIWTAPCTMTRAAPGTGGTG